MISIKTPQEIAIMAEDGKILAGIMKQLIQMVQPGITTKKLNKVAEDLIFKFGAEPGFKGPISKGYGGFPTALCASVNQIIVHGVPSDCKLKDGDILSLDLGLKYPVTYTTHGRGLNKLNKDDKSNNKSKEKDSYFADMVVTENGC